MIKRTVIIFLILEVLDIATTIFAVQYLGLIELNFLVHKFGIYPVLIIKIVTVAIVAYCVQKIDFHRREWIFPAFIGVPVAWNIANLLMCLGL